MINVILVDDEPLALERFQQLLADFRNINIVGIYLNPKDVLENSQIDESHCIFIDIDMPEMGGLELAAKVKDMSPSIQIVFVTAYEQFALKAFDVQALDYLLKPVSKKRLENTINRIKKSHPSSGHNVEVISNKKLKVELIGDFKVTSFESGEAIRWKTTKVKELFAILISRFEFKESRDELIRMLWPQNTYMSAKTSLHTNISYLKKDLKNMGLDNMIWYSDEYYYIDIERLDIDILPLYHVFSIHDRIDHTNLTSFELLLKHEILDVMSIFRNREWYKVYYLELKEKYLEALAHLMIYYEEIGNDESYILSQAKIERYSSNNLV